MSTTYYDPDEWETVYTSGGDGLNRWASCSQHPRSPELIAKIRAEKRKAHEDKILAEADAIRAARRRSGPSTASTGEER